MQATQTTADPARNLQSTTERVEKPWGHELIFAHTDRYVGKIIHIEAGHQLSRQYHQTKDETLLVESGELDLEVGPDEDSETIHMHRRDVFRIRPGVIHRLIGVTDVDVIEVSTTELDDVVRLADDYGRTGTSAR
jgi:mannose-6-phosphate isomerase-like protein (cupin superfamily)